MRATRTFFAAALPLALGLASSGCIKKMLVDGQIEGTRQASAAFDTIGDYELARTAAQAGLVQFEGMHRLAPNNEDALFLLAKGWGGYAFGFVEDEMETAADAGDDDLADYHRKRAKMAYDRAIFYGLELLGKKADGFEAARKNDASIKQWLADSFTDAEKDAPNLFWTGYAWMSRVNLLKGVADVGEPYIAELFVGVAMVERAVALDASYNHFAGRVALAAYHSSSGMADHAQAKRIFDETLTQTQRKTLVVQLNYGTKYACVKGDRALYEQMLHEVLESPDPDPEQRLTNAIAKRRAKRWLGRQHMMDCGMDLSAPSPAPGPAPAVPK